MRLHNLYLIILATILTFCSSPPKEKELLTDQEIVLTGLDGRIFTKPDWSESTKIKLDSNLEVAHQNLLDSATEENYVWLGRREAYLYNYRRALEIFSEGIQRFPESYALRRHRGHRYITVRDFDNAINDLKVAAELMPSEPIETEPDGQPNRLNIPLSSTQYNVWYHLGLAYYLKQDFENAKVCYQHCLDYSINDDLKCASIDWLYMTLRRMNEKDEASALLMQITAGMNIIENDSYYQRLLMYKGELPADALLNVDAKNDDVDLALATQGYGVGNWYLCEGDSAKAIQIYEKVVSGKHYASFGFIAAEADLTILKNGK